MKCPFCNTEMLPGYLNCGAAIWSERKHHISVNPDRSEKYALRLRFPLVDLHHVESFCCPNCKTILIDAKNHESALK